MRKLFLILLVTIPLSGFSKKYIPEKDVFMSFFSSHTYVVMQDNPFSEYNTAIKSAVEKHWTLTKFTIIKPDEFDALRKDPKNSFIVLTRDLHENDKMPAVYDFVNIMIGKNVNKIDNMPYIFSFPLKYTKEENEEYATYLDMIILFAQKHLERVKENPDKLLRANMFKIYNKQTKKIKNTTLYVNEDCLSEQVKPENIFRQYYKHPFIFCTDKDIKTASEKDNVTFLFKVGPENTKFKSQVFKFILDNKGNMYYYSRHVYNNVKKPDGFLISDIKKINK